MDPKIVGVDLEFRFSDILQYSYNHTNMTVILKY